MKKFNQLRCCAYVLLVIFTAIFSSAHAQELKLGMKSPVDLVSVRGGFPNPSVVEHIYDPLICVDAAGVISACLAQSWKMIDPLTWEFKLRKGVKFHNGQEFTAEDAIWTLNKITKAYGEGDGVKLSKESKEAKEGNFLVDKYTIRLVLGTPTPNLLSQLSNIPMKSKLVEKASDTEVIGTGPYKFVKPAKKDFVQLERNEEYWQMNPSVWKKVSMSFIPDVNARLKALLAGQLDAMEDVPMAEVEKLRSNPLFSLVSKTSGRFIFLGLDIDRSRSPFVFDKTGAVLDKNPLKNIKVRQAISLAIDREMIRDQVMKGLSEPTNNFVKPTSPAFSDKNKAIRFNVLEAKKLLNDAGYKDGFKLTLHGSSNNYVNDTKVLQAIAEMLNAIGITATAESSTMDKFLQRGRSRQFSAMLLGWNAIDADPMALLTEIAFCEPLRDKSKGEQDNNNWARYCNDKVDVAIKAAMRARSEKEHMQALKEAYGLVINDAAYIPIHQQMNSWVVSKKLRFVTRNDDKTHAFNFFQK
ncbi:MAG: ABC transporter substrate-binding protein [Undibacterium sp.]|nr:ABC transporter substrate-binding protein [Undibacterium sp.]